MFLSSCKTKTPISTYSDSYKAPTSIKEVYKDPSLLAWQANKFVTPGLSQTTRHHVNPETLQKMVKRAVQDYSCRGSIPGHPYFPEKYWLSQEEDKCNPNYLCNDQYNTWRMGPCNCTGWNKYTTCLPQLPKEAGMETVVRGMPLEYPPKPERLNAYEREVVVNMLNLLSRNQPLPHITPRCGCIDPLRGRLPFQGYESACSGRHYCLRGMNYCATRAPGMERHLQPLGLMLPTVRAQSLSGLLKWENLQKESPKFPILSLRNWAQGQPGFCICSGGPTGGSALPYEHRAGMRCTVLTPPPSYYPCPNLRWDTSHFKKTGGPERNNYVIHPEFVSEAYPDYHC